MNENQTEKKGFGRALRVLALSLAIVMIWQIVSPSMLRVIGALAEEGSALAKIYGILSEKAGEPTTAEDYYELANISIGQRAYDKALDELEKARTLTEEEDKELLAELWLKSASVYILTGKMEEAQSALDASLALNEQSSQGLLLRAQIAIEKTDYRSAVEDLRKYIVIVPTDTATRQTLAQLLESLTDYKSASGEYKKLSEQIPSDESHLLNSLRCQFLAGEYEEALAAFETFIGERQSGAQSPYLSIAEFLRAACLMQLGRFSEAAEGFASAQQHGYDEATCYEQMVMCYFEDEAYQQAVECGEKLIAMEATLASPDAFHQRMGASLVQLERHEEALTHLTASMELNPALIGSAYYRGVSLLALKRYEEAVADFTTSIEQGFLTQFCYYNRGVCHVQLLNYELAIDDMGMTLSSGEDEALNSAAKDILWQLAAYYEKAQAAESGKTK